MLQRQLERLQAKDVEIKSSMGEIPISVPQDRNSDFEPQVVPKYKRDISEIEGKVITMYARGMSVSQISDQIRDIYGFEVSEGMAHCFGGLHKIWDVLGDMVKSITLRQWIFDAFLD